MARCSICDLPQKLLFSFSVNFSKLASSQLWRFLQSFFCNEKKLPESAPAAVDDVKSFLKSAA